VQGQTVKIVYAVPFEPVVWSRSILGLGLPSSANVIANDHYQSIGIVCNHGTFSVSRVSGRSALILIWTSRYFKNIYGSIWSYRKLFAYMWNYSIYVYSLDCFYYWL